MQYFTEFDSEEALYTDSNHPLHNQKHAVRCTRIGHGGEEDLLCSNVFLFDSKSGTRQVSMDNY
jgi:hypothetical protein